ncbi:MAG: ion channel [Alphaproteobacteria bacterium]
MSAKRTRHRHRLSPIDGRREQPRVFTIGGNRHRFADLYAELLAMSWQRMLSLTILLYIVANIGFALVYLRLGGIAHARPGVFSDAFFFSVQTMATIGFGNMAPEGFTANLLVTIEALMGFAFLALLAGLLFNKFSRPTARILFSDGAVICDYEGAPHLMLRLANERSNRIVDARIQAVVLRDEKSKEGHIMRRFRDLKLARTHVPFLQLSWTVLHRIDEKSPLHGKTNADLKRENAEVVVSLIGIDETMMQTIHARHSYEHDAIHFNSAFVDILKRGDDSTIEVDYDKFHHIRKLKKA